MRTLLVAALPALLAAQAPGEIQTTRTDQRGLAVTIYNSNLALVKDQREVKLPKGDFALAFQEVSAQIRPETALLRNLTQAKGFWVVEQNFDFDLLSPQKLLEKYVGKKVGVMVRKAHATDAGFDEVREEATVLATNEGTVLQFADRIETSAPGRIVFPGVPANLRARPTLVVSAHSPQASAQKLELSYLTGGLSWKADYVANLAPDEKTLDLSGWVTLGNQSGVDYPEATLQLVAGDVNQVREQVMTAGFVGRAKGLMPVAPPAMQEQSLFEYHLYTLDRPTTIRSNQTKQVALLSAAQVPAAKEYVMRGQANFWGSSGFEPEDKIKAGVYMQFENKESARLGMPLPKGVVRVYKRDSEGRAQFVGEDSVDHTPRNERVRLKLGDAFDITGRRKQTDFKSLGRMGQWRTVNETAVEVEVRNAKKEPITVKVLEAMSGDWEILEESHKHTKESSGLASFQVTVPPEGKATLTYRVRVRW